MCILFVDCSSGVWHSWDSSEEEQELDDPSKKTDGE